MFPKNALTCSSYHSRVQHVINHHISCQSIIHTFLYSSLSSRSRPGIEPIHVAATLFLNCRSLCCACKVNLSTAYPNLSFFALNCFNRIASLPSPLMPTLVLSLPNALPLPPEAVLLRRSSPMRPSRSSERAISACSRRDSLSKCVEMRLRRLSSSGVSVERRLVLAESRADSGRRSKCCEFHIRTERCS